ncbi:MAG: dihydrofolate reductase [Planctomycetes bacterium]|nr:dihydrofolate reductase [Planctomycetota bacterium]MCP4860379.1 dihydrofolate reductase [Planctomycetota bacterium]
MDCARGIGRDGDMPWHLPSDLKYFAKITKGETAQTGGALNTVIMGRKTWDSIPERFRPLAGRTNIVISRQRDLPMEGAALAQSLEQALEMADSSSDCFVIGGATIYEMALAHPDCGDLLITEIDSDFDCAVFFPALDGFERIEQGERSSDGDLNLRFCRWRRCPQAQ